MTNSTEQLPSIFTRTPDAQFDAMDALLANAKRDMETSTQKVAETNTIDFVELGGSIGMVIDIRESNLDPVPTPHPLTHYSLQQSCRMAGIGTDIIRRLQVLGRNDLGVDNLNTLFPNSKDDCKIILLDANQRVRALNGADYSRLWDYVMFNEANRILVPNGFKPAVFANGCGQLLRAGSTGLFRGDQTSFGFFFTDDVQVQDAQLGNMRQGIMIWNSEVGARSFGFSVFYFRKESGTIILWDRKSEHRKRFVHRGDITRGFREYITVIRDTARHASDARTADLATFNAAANTPFALSTAEAIEKLNKVFDMPIGQAEAVVRASRLPQNASGPDLSVWRISLGISYEAAQTSRAESMVDDASVATKVIRRSVK